MIADLPANIYPQSNDKYGTMEPDLLGGYPKVWTVEASPHIL